MYLWNITSLTFSCTCTTGIELWRCYFELHVLFCSWKKKNRLWALNNRIAIWVCNIYGISYDISVLNTPNFYVLISVNRRQNKICLNFDNAKTQTPILGSNSSTIMSCVFNVKSVVEPESHIGFFSR